MEDNRIIIRLASACNKVKSHPYLVDYNPEHLRDFMQKFDAMSGAAYEIMLPDEKHFRENDIDYYNHTHICLSRALYHDTHADLGCIFLNKYGPDTDRINFGRFKIRLHSIISIYEALSQGKEIYSVPSGYSNAVYRMIACENGYYRLITEASEEYFSRLRTLLEREVNRCISHGSNYCQNSRKAYEARIADIDNKTGIFYLISHEENNV